MCSASMDEMIADITNTLELMDVADLSVLEELIADLEGRPKDDLATTTGNNADDTTQDTDKHNITFCPEEDEDTYVAIICQEESERQQQFHKWRGQKQRLVEQLKILKAGVGSQNAKQSEK